MHWAIMILLLVLMLCGLLCNAQNNPFFPGTPVLQASSLARAGTPLSQSSRALSGSPLIESSGSSGVAGSPLSQSIAAAGTPDYVSCVRSQPDAAVRSRSRLSYSLLESTFTNPALKDFYNTSFDVKDFFQVIYDELKATWFHKARLLAGALSLLFESTFPRVSPLVNAVTITNAISEFLSLKVVITTEEFDDYVDAYINDVSKGLRNEDGSPRSNAKAIVTALLNFLAQNGDLSYSSLHEFISILAGNYRIALYSSCLPSSFNEIPNL